MKLIGLRSVLSCALLVANLEVIHAQSAPAAAPASPLQSPSIALSPAVVMLRGKPGQSATQTLTINNGMPTEMSFDVVAEDVVVRDGKRVFVPAGQVPSSIALGAVAAPASVVAPPGQSVSVNVTLTAPAGNTQQRAVIVFFKTKVPDAAKGSVTIGASLGALITFNLSDDIKVQSGPIATTPQTASANLGLSQELENTGAEPIVPKGVVAILDDHGKRVAKAAFDSHRLLPGERAVFAVTSPAVLIPGRYRALSSFEYEGKVLTNVGEFTVSE
jgi:hypothetical protein